MELKTASPSPQSCLLSPAEILEKGPVPPPALSALGRPAPLASRGLGTPYPLFTGPFLEHVVQSPLIPFKKLNWPLSRPKAKRRRASPGSRWPRPASGLGVQVSSALLHGVLSLAPSLWTQPGLSSLLRPEGRGGPAWGKGCFCLRAESSPFWPPERPQGAKGEEKRAGVSRLEGGGTRGRKDDGDGEERRRRGSHWRGWNSGGRN